jgi:hypothetical protein
MSEENNAAHEELGEEEIDVEEEVEITDEENDGGSDYTSSAVQVEAPVATVHHTPGKKPTGSTPGHTNKVTPSKAVKDMKMRTPESVPRHSSATLSLDKNPFPTFGAWTVTTLGQIEVCFPILTGKNETTNELTRSTRPEARYWKAPVTFKYGNYTSEVMRFDNVHIPHHTGKGYGSSYVYLCLPGFAGNAFAEAGKKRAPTRVTENSLVPNKEKWWKIANKVEDVFGVISHETKRFHQKSLETIFDATQSGISCSVVLKFYCKASTTELEALRPTTARTVSIEVVRGYINEMDINVQMPARVNRERAKVEPTASAKDVATDSLMKRLGELGL